MLSASPVTKVIPIPAATYIRPLIHLTFERSGHGPSKSPTASRRFMYRYDIVRRSPFNPTLHKSGEYSLIPTVPDPAYDYKTRL